LTQHNTLLEQYEDDIRQLEEKLKLARDKERILIQRHIHAARKKRAREEMRRVDSADTILKFEELEQRIEFMEAEADLINSGHKPLLEEELERLAFDEEIERELQLLKSPPLDKMEKRVESLETILDNQEREEINHEQL
jgi:phage shock protein A